ncbi:MAG: N-acetyltransferase [Spirochaetes bacterium]|nr:N-acetyltransferase [Spirochaetota bacterium]
MAKKKLFATQARAGDVAGIVRIIKRFSGVNLLLPRSEDSIYHHLADFFVIREGKEVIGCAALTIYSQRYAEIGSVAVMEDHQKSGIGRMLVHEAFKRAKKYKIENIFLLTYVPNFFKHFGFKRIDKDSLPHKIWKDCLNCKYFPNCNEIAMIVPVKDAVL